MLDSLNLGWKELLLPVLGEGWDEGPLSKSEIQNPKYEVSMDAAQALLIGIDSEKSSYSFYKGASELCGDASGRRLFASLADVELGHVRYLESLYSGLTSDGNWQLSHVEEVPTCPVDIERPDLFPCAPVEDTRKCQTLEGDLHLLDQALEREKEAMAFYKNLAETLDDPTGRTVFQYLVSEEQDHERVLMEARQHLAQKQTWHQT